MFTGLIGTIPLGTGGYNANKNTSQLQPSELLQALNVSYYAGTLQKEGGSAQYNTSGPIVANLTILGGYDWWPVPGTQSMIVIGANGTMYKDTGAGTFPTQVQAGRAATGGYGTANPQFKEGGKSGSADNKKLFIFDGANAPVYISGTANTTTALASPPVDWTGNPPVWSEVHIGRLWAGGNANDPHRAYYSVGGLTIDDFNAVGSGSIEIYPGVGDRTVCAISFMGQLIVFKNPVGIYAVNASDPEVYNWTVSEMSKAIGMAGPNAWTPLDDDIMFMDASGNVHLLSTVKEYGDYGLAPISQAKYINNFFIDNINLSGIYQCKAITYGAKLEVHFALPKINSSVNNIRLVVDLNQNETPRFRYSDKDGCQAIWLRRDSAGIRRPVTGDNQGLVWLLDNAAFNTGGLGYISTFQTANSDFSYIDPRLSTLKKQFKFLELVFEPTGSWFLGIDIYTDGFYKQTVYYNMGVTISGLGSFTLDTNLLAGGVVSSRRKRVACSGRRIALAGNLGGANQNFSVSSAYVHFKIGDENANK